MLAIVELDLRSFHNKHFGINRIKLFLYKNGRASFRITLVISPSNVKLKRLFNIAVKNKVLERSALKVDGTLSDILAVEATDHETEMPHYIWRSTQGHLWKTQGMFYNTHKIWIITFLFYCIFILPNKVYILRFYVFVQINISCLVQSETFTFFFYQFSRFQFFI